MEDDYDGEYRYQGPPLPALKSLDRQDRVVYTGTFSKVLFAGIRLAYCVVPARKIPEFEEACAEVASGACPVLMQKVVFDFLEQGHFARHIKKMRSLYAKRRQYLADALLALGPGRIDVRLQAGGMHLLARPRALATDAQLAAVPPLGYRSHALSSWGVDGPGPQGLILGFANLASREHAEQVVRELEAAWFPPRPRAPAEHRERAPSDPLPSPVAMPHGPCIPLKTVAGGGCPLPEKSATRYLNTREAAMKDLHPKPPAIFLAGATGAIGSRLLPRLVALGHRVHGSTRSAAKVPALLSAGAVPVVVDVFDADALTAAMRAAQPDIVIHQLTDLPRGLDPSQMEEGVRRNARIRAEGTANVVAAARASGARLLIAQSIAWAYAPGPEPYAEESPLDIHAQGLRAISVSGVAALEKAVLEAPGLVGMVLRYGQLYGPGTGDATRGDRKLPLHVDGAAAAMLLAMRAEKPGVFNIVEANGTVDTGKAQRELGWQPQGTPIAP